MKTREERVRHAHEHCTDITKRLEQETKQSIDKTSVYSGLQTRAIPSDKNIYNVRLVDLDSVSCLFDKLHEGKVCVLNYASFKYPGGYFLGGSAAQEEALCHESNLYPVLLAFEDVYYKANRKNTNLSLYHHRGLYSPDIVFEHNGETKLADVLTCAAPNYNSAKKYHNVSMEKNLHVFNERIRFMLQIAEANNVDTLITGAWGCGVFKQPPIETCELLMKELVSGNYNIPNIYLAIPNANSPNYKGFKQVLDKLKDNGGS